MSVWNKVDAAEVVTNKKDFGPLPDGSYEAEVTDVEIKEDVFGAVKISVEFTLTKEHEGRKCWFNTQLSETTSDKAFAFFKKQVCKLAGVESTNGDPQTVLANCKGNTVMITTKNVESTKTPGKMFTNVYVDECVHKSDDMPF
jgi:hypothetical protein